MGTALTTTQLRALRRSAQEVRLCFDGDSAGQQAAWRSAEAARGVPVELSAVRLPPGADPGDLGSTAEGRTQLSEAVDGAEPLVTSLIRGRASRAGRSPRERDHALEDITELLRATVGREVSPRIALERSVLLVALAADDELRQTGLASLSAEVFDDHVHGEIFALMAGGVALDDWPSELSGVTTALRAEVVGATTATELQEAVSRLQVDELDRRIAAARTEQDEQGLLEALTLRSELRTRLRGEQ